MIEASVLPQQPTPLLPSMSQLPTTTAQALVSSNKATYEQQMAWALQPVSMTPTPTTAPRSGCDLPAITSMLQVMTEFVGKLVDLVSSLLKLKSDSSQTPTAATPPTAGSLQPQATSSQTQAAPQTAPSAAQTTTPSASPSTTTAPSSGGTTDASGCDCQAGAPTPNTPTLTATPPSTTATAGRKAPPVGRALGASGEFLWKPVSEKDGKLAILLPKSLTGKVKDVMILSPDKKTILQKGRFSGVGNGDRSHYRFAKAGSEYPDGAVVLVRLNNGESRYIAIKETSSRFTK
jgi:hypothetical protein